MEREMRQIKVFINEKSYICISQYSALDEDALILLHPDQLELFIQWLREARDELQNKEPAS